MTQIFFYKNKPNNCVPDNKTKSVGYRLIRQETNQKSGLGYKVQPNKNLNMNKAFVG